MHPPFIIFEGIRYGLDGQYYRKSSWGKPGPSNLHRAIWISVYGSIPEDHDVHHLDEDTFNNDINNLAIIHKADHQRIHALRRYEEGTLKPPSKVALEKAAEWHRSEEGLAWHSENGKKAWDKRTWYDAKCTECGQEYRTCLPKKAKYCHLNCKMRALRRRKGANVVSEPAQPALAGKRKPA